MKRFQVPAVVGTVIGLLGWGLWFLAGGLVETGNEPGQSLLPEPVAAPGEAVSTADSVGDQRPGSSAGGMSAPEQQGSNAEDAEHPGGSSGQQVPAGFREEQQGESAGSSFADEAIVYSPTRDGIEAAVREGMDAIVDCYEGWLRDDPELSGRIVVSFSIETSEEDPSMAWVAEVAVYDSEFQHLALEGCTLSVFEEMLFEAPEKGGVLKVRYPLVLSTDPEDSPESENQ